MKLNKWLFLIVALGAICIASAARALPQWAPPAPEEQLWAQAAPVPVAPQQPSDIVPGAAPFDTNGLSFTNITYKIELGTELQNAGTFTYAAGDADLSRAFNVNTGPIDFGAASELTFSTKGNGLHSFSVGLEAIKNFPNWQLVGKLEYSRTLEDNFGNYLLLEFDLNYNLAAGTGWGFLSTAGGSYAFTGGGVSWSNRNASFDQANVDKYIRLYLGWAF